MLSSSAILARAGRRIPGPSRRDRDCSSCRSSIPGCPQRRPQGCPRLWGQVGLSSCTDQTGAAGLWAGASRLWKRGPRVTAREAAGRRRQSRRTTRSAQSSGSRSSRPASSSSSGCATAARTASARAGEPVTGRAGASRSIRGRRCGHIPEPWRTGMVRAPAPPAHRPSRAARSRPRDRASGRADGLLQQHEGGQADDPAQVHHAAEKQQRHQEPAAAQAPAAVLQAHAQRAPAAATPVARQEAQRRAAVAQAPRLDRRELPQAGWVLSRGANPQPSQGIAPRRRLLARTYRQLDLDQRRTLFRLAEARTPVGEIAPGSVVIPRPSIGSRAATASATATAASAATSR